MIRFNKQTGVFSLETKRTSYQMRLVGEKYLEHLYYGPKAKEEILHLQYPGVYGLDSASPRFEIDLPITESLWEAPTFGQGDERPPMLKYRNDYGDTVGSFKYVRHHITAKKPDLSPMPSLRADGSKTLDVTLKDEVANLTLTLYYTVYEDCDVIARTYTLKNNGKPVELLKAASLALDLERSDLDMVSLYGAWSRECNLSKAPLHTGLQQIGTIRGETSAQHNCFVALGARGATEDSGEVYASNLVYSGNHKEEVFVDDFKRTRLLTGINDDTFSKILKRGDTFTAPEAVLTFSEEGYGGMSRNFHDLIRNHLSAPAYRDRRVMLLNSWEGTWFDINEEKLFDYALAAKECGVEMLVMDDGWFGKRDSDRGSLGDWFVYEKKFPHGLSAFVDRINGIGMKFGIWFEPEMISEDSDLYRAHPDYCLHVPGRPRREGRNQLVLDMTRQDVVDNIAEQMSAILSSCNVEYVKWDMNRGLSEVASAARNRDGQREVYHDYVLGVYRLYRTLQERFPHILFENCSSGGARFDMGMLYFSPQIWTSDNTDPFYRPKIQYGCSYAYPLATMSAHISDTPNGTSWVKTSLEYRLAVSLGGVLGYELPVSRFTPEEKEEVRKQIAFYREVEPLILKGDLYRLLNPFEDASRAAQILVAKDKSAAFVDYLQLSEESHPAHIFLRLKGLDENKRYRISGTDEVYYGKTLMDCGLRFTLGSEHGKAKMFLLKEVK